MWLSTYRAYYPARSFGGKTTKQMKRLAEYENDLAFQNVFNSLVNVALNLFEWEGLPETCDDRFFEEMLLFMGQACIVKDDEYNGFLNLPCTPASSMNIYYEYPVYRAFSLDYNKEFIALTDYNKDIYQKLSRNYDVPNLKMTGCVCIDNEMRYPMLRTIEMYATRIAKTIRAIDVVQTQLKIPMLIGTSEDSKASIQNAMDNIDMNIEAIYVENGIKKALQDTVPIDLSGAPDRITYLWDTLNNWYSQALTALGVNNLNTSDKKERLLTDEVNSNDDFIKLNSAYRLDMRLHFADFLNECFGLNVSCKLRHDFASDAATMIQNGEPKTEGSAQNGNVQPNI